MCIQHLVKESMDEPSKIQLDVRIFMAVEHIVYHKAALILNS